ncbi:MAG: hypothetical protein RIG62_00530 [Cyclobacteriaceae bacterium]
MGILKLVFVIALALTFLAHVYLKNKEDLDSMINDLEKAFGASSKKDYLRSLALKYGYSNHQFSLAYEIAQKVKSDSYIRNLAKNIKSVEDAFKIAQETPQVKIAQIVKKYYFEKIA